MRILSPEMPPEKFFEKQALDTTTHLEGHLHHFISVSWLGD